MEKEDRDWLSQDWSEIEGAAAGTEVRLFMWGGDEGINTYFDEWAIPEAEKKLDLTIERVPIDTEDSLQRLLTEKQAGKQDGTMDILWVNAENFRNAKENELLYGSFAEKLPNYNKYIDRSAPENTYDFGTETEGLEAPWGKVQFTYIYDKAKIEEPPETLAQLIEWTKENPGKFTYPEPNDFTGNAFLRHLIYEHASVEDILERGFDEQWAEGRTEAMWDNLEEWESSLWREGETYPASLAELDRLFSRGEVWMSMGYNEARAESLIRDGTFPESTGTFVLDDGSIGNTHFLSIPYNTTNAPGALAVINFLLSPEAQAQKLKPEMWGESSVLDFDKLDKEEQEAILNINRGRTVLDQERLNEVYLPEMDAAYVRWIEEKWEDEVLQ
ncbi:ABC transporter substrate-binding protein [Alteribacillus sp. HJP-4]|uniref:ABC transporter substrate-binding protein n=1 Tax=Alteribacillus sp. HJP-4 TaxID=2775394 RepID=UPI0035CCD4DF